MLLTLNPKTMLLEREGKASKVGIITVRLDNGLEAIVERTDNLSVGDTIWVFTLEDLKGFVSSPSKPSIILYKQEVKVIYIEEATRAELSLIEGCIFLYEIAHTYGKGHNYTLCVSSRNPSSLLSSMEDSSRSS